MPCPYSSHSRTFTLLLQTFIEHQKWNEWNEEEGEEIFLNTKYTSMRVTIVIYMRILSISTRKPSQIRIDSMLKASGLVRVASPWFGGETNRFVIYEKAPKNMFFIIGRVPNRTERRNAFCILISHSIEAFNDCTDTQAHAHTRLWMVSLNLFERIKLPFLSVQISSAGFVERQLQTVLSRSA